MASPSQNSYTMDLATELRDRNDPAVTADGVEPLVLDFGNVSGTGEEQVAYTKGTLVVDADVFEIGGGEQYEIHVQLSNSPTFASNSVVRAILGLGFTPSPDITVGIAISPQPFRAVLGVDNEYGGEIYRYMRLATVASVGTAPSIEYGAFLAQNQ